MYLIVYFAFLWYGSVSASLGDFNYQFNRTIYDPNKTSLCQNRSADFEAHANEFCSSILRWHRNHPDEPCADYWVNNQKTLNEKGRTAAQHASVQYCNGTSEFIPCVKCLNLATEPLWNEPLCAEYDRWKPVAECLRNYTNTAFNWSREVILNGANVTKVVSLTSPPYNKCRDYFEEEFGLSEDITVKFPVFVPYYSTEDDQNYNVMLSFFLNAFEDNNPNGTTINETSHSYGFRCQNFYYNEYLYQYKDRMDMPFYPGPVVVRDYYKRLRSDMCYNETTCMACFSKADEILLVYFMDYNFKIEYLIRDFQKMSTTYYNCLQSHNISQEYVTILNNSHTGMERLNIKNCSEDSIQVYGFLKNNTDYLNTNNQTKNKPFIDVTNFNIYSTYGYAAKQLVNETCEAIENSEMDCFFKQTKKLIENTEGNITRREEEQALDTFTFLLLSCSNYPIE